MRQTPEGSLVSRESTLSPELLANETLGKARARTKSPDSVAGRRAQAALAGRCRDPRLTSTLTGRAA
jgi:hypothetical protein